MKFKIWYEQDKKLHTIIIESVSKDRLKYDKDYPKNIINIKELKKLDFKNLFIKKDEEELLELFYEMSIMLKSKLQIKEIIELLLDIKFKKYTQEILVTINNALKNGHPIYKALKPYENHLGYLCILFFKLGEQNSNFQNSISSLYEILRETNNIKTKIKSTLRYPFILVFGLIIALILIFSIVLPQFEYIFNQFNNNLPYSTYILLKIRDFLSYHYITILVSIVIVYIIFKILQKRFQLLYDKYILLYIPFFSDMYRYLIFYKLFLSLSLIVKSKLQFTYALESTKEIVNNQFLIAKLDNILIDINNGISISKAFQQSNIFDNTTIRLLLTAQQTNTIEDTLDNLTIIHKEKLNKYISKFTSFLEPFLIFIISSIILWIVLAIMTPVWQLSSIIK